MHSGCSLTHRGSAMHHNSQQLPHLYDSLPVSRDTTFDTLTGRPGMLDGLRLNVVGRRQSARPERAGQDRRNDKSPSQPLDDGFNNPPLGDTEPLKKTHEPETDTFNLLRGFGCRSGNMQKSKDSRPAHFTVQRWTSIERAVHVCACSRDLWLTLQPCHTDRHTYLQTVCVCAGL